jgi:hypothetical protein
MAADGIGHLFAAGCLQVTTSSWPQYSTTNTQQLAAAAEQDWPPPAAAAAAAVVHMQQ